MNMMVAANMSGRAINIARTNICHSISYPLTEIYNIPHGLACAASLAYFTSKAIKLDLSQWLGQFKLKLPEIDKDRVAKIALKNPKLKDYPFKITHKDIIKSISVI